MIVDFRIEISFMCPACGNYFYGRGVRSYNTFWATFFSDGSSLACYRPFWLTHCPRCKQFFAKEHLFRLPESICLFPPKRGLPYWTKRELENDKLFGRLDGFFGADEPKVIFIENAIAQGLYFPVQVSECQKKGVQNTAL